MPFSMYSWIVLLSGIILLYFTLSILLDSGNSFQLVFQNREFVQEVLKLLAEILAGGDIHNRSIVINIEEYAIEEKDNVLDEMNS